jgi:hypothetical protein
MRVNRDLTLKLTVSALAAATLGATAGGAVPLAGARTAVGWTCSAGQGAGAPDAAPPILRTMSCADRDAVRLQERLEIAETSDRLPATARYSDAEMNAYAGEEGGDSRTR